MSYNPPVTTTPSTTPSSGYKYSSKPLAPTCNQKVSNILVDINEPYTRSLIVECLASKGTYEVKMGPGEGDNEVETEEGWFQVGRLERLERSER
jgi:hypothetical protein